MKEALNVLLPKLLAQGLVEWRIIDHGSKQNLLSRLPDRMKGYAAWPEPQLKVLVLVDQDSDDCFQLKATLEGFATVAGLDTKTSPGPGKSFKVVNRVVVEELEAWFLGDIPALVAAYPGVPASLGQRAGFRDPDGVTGGTWEALLKVLQASGHFRGLDRLPKIEVARRISPKLSLVQSNSRSYRIFIEGIQALVSA